MSAAKRIVRFSCGAASAVAAKMTLSRHSDVLILNAFIEQEHPDNRRFLKDCERWFGCKVQDASAETPSTYAVWMKRRFMASRMGAPCSDELKRKPLAKATPAGSVTVIGFTSDSRDAARAGRIEEAFPDEEFEFPLIEAGLTKADCLAMIERAGIELPLMYRLGYKNANCIGCVKGGEGYWNKIRKDFPEQFSQIVQIQESLGPGAYLFRDRKTGERYGLKDLPEGKGRYDDEPDISCGIACSLVEEEWNSAP